MEKYIEKVALLMEALPYIQEFRDAIVVVKFGGSAMEKPEIIEAVLRDVVLMECVGMKPVIVHGGGKAISARLENMGLEVKRTGGMRHTCDVTIDVVDDVLTEDTIPNPKTVYGKSKLASEEYIMASQIPKNKRVYIRWRISICYVLSHR